MTAKNDGIYTEAGGSVVIEGFKNLTVKGTGYFSLDYDRPTSSCL